MPLVGTYSKKTVCQSCSLFTAKLLPALKEKRLLLSVLNIDHVCLGALLYFLVAELTSQD